MKMGVASLYVQKYVVDITTSADDGTATAYTPMVNGRVLSIQYIKDSTVAFTDGVDFSVKTADTDQSIWVQTNVDASAIVAPRQATHSTAGIAALYAAVGTAVNDFVYVANERIKIAISSGGNSKQGRFVVQVG
jgi:hypothetical protein